MNGFLEDVELMGAVRFFFRGGWGFVDMVVVVWGGGEGNDMVGVLCSVEV